MNSMIFVTLFCARCRVPMMGECVDSPNVVRVCRSCFVRHQCGEKK